MNEFCFVDSNLWIYAAIADGSKSERARALIENGQIVISTQVINEVSFNLLRKYRYSENEIAVFIRQISATCHVYPVTIATCFTASKLRQCYKLSFWDSMIVAVALDSHCTVLYSEDMQHEQQIEKQLIIRNPFSESEF
jgi:predicted nucleic acid-binding protein